MTSSVTIRAYAKINWGLELLGKRHDGYHEIRTVTQTISLYDELEVATASAGVSLTLGGEWPVPAGPDNISCKAAEAFRAAFGAPPGVSIALTKHVPPASGLGGGSSDCVATLVALARLTGTHAPDTIHELTAALGSDTVLFLVGGAALCSGRGEIVTPVRGKRTYHLVVARPDCSVATREAYGLMAPDDFTSGDHTGALAAHLEAGVEPSHLAGELHNAFRPKIGARYPQIEALLHLMLDAGALGAEMTGSGSAVFGLADDASAADNIARTLVSHGYWAVPAHTVGEGFAFPQEQTDE